MSDAVPHKRHILYLLASEPSRGGSSSEEKTNAHMYMQGDANDLAGIFLFYFFYRKN